MGCTVFAGLSYVKKIYRYHCSISRPHHQTCCPQGAALSRFISPGGQMPQQTMYNSSEFMRLVHNTLQFSGDPIWYDMAIFFQYHHKIHPIGSMLAWEMRCILRVQNLNSDQLDPWIEDQLQITLHTKKLECGTWYHHPRRLQCVWSRNLRIFKVATWHYRCRHNLKNICIWDNLQCCLLVPRPPSKPVMLTFDLQSRKV